MLVPPSVQNKRWPARSLQTDPEQRVKFYITEKELNPRYSEGGHENGTTILHARGNPVPQVKERKSEEEEGNKEREAISAHSVFFSP